MMVDGQFTLVGSTNWTYNALTNNHEVAVLVKSKQVAKEMIDYFKQPREIHRKPLARLQIPNPKLQIPKIPSSDVQTESLDLLS